MKNMLMVLMLMVSQAVAEGDEPHDICVAVSSLAESVLKSRYRGVSLHEQMAVVEHDRLLVYVVKKAYERRFFYDEVRRADIVTFGGEMYSECMAAYGKD